MTYLFVICSEILGDILDHKLVSGPQKKGNHELSSFAQTYINMKGFVAHKKDLLVSDVIDKLDHELLSGAHGILDHELISSAHD